VREVARVCRPVSLGKVRRLTCDMLH